MYWLVIPIIISLITYIGIISVSYPNKLYSYQVINDIIIGISNQYIEN